MQHVTCNGMLPRFDDRKKTVLHVAKVHWFIVLTITLQHTLCVVGLGVERRSGRRMSSGRGLLAIWRIVTSFPVFPTTSGRRDVTSGRYTDVLKRYDVISGVSLLSPTTSGQLPVTSGRYDVTSGPIPRFQSDMTSFPVCPDHFRSTSGHFRSS